MRAELPPGYRLVRAGRAFIVAREEAAGWVQAAVVAGDTLYEYARNRGAGQLAGGRGLVALVAAPSGPWAVRHYHRGGALAPLFADRYARIATPRPFAELAVSVALRQRGVPTPEAHASVVYPAGVWYRGDIATAFIPGARDLAALTFGPEPSSESERVAAWHAAGALLRASFRAGLLHPDLNLRNILVRADAAEALLLDLDRCRLGIVSSRDVERMIGRFQRSRRKLEAAAATRVGAAELGAFEAGLAA